MKKGKLLLVAMLTVLLSVICACSDMHVHDYGEWQITKAPTLEEEGVYAQSCKCGVSVEEVIPALSDDTVWTLSETVDPTHTETGKTVYTSVEFGELVVEIPTIPHGYGEYTLVNNPTLTETGWATHVCETCQTPDTVEVPALTDEAWAVERVESTHYQSGTATYTSVYGVVELSLELDPTHEYGDYTIVEEPTAEKEGTATRTCPCSEIEEVTVPALTDEVWAVETVDATHFNKGSETYTSVYGTVVVELPIVPHTFGNYSFLQYPTLTSGGRVNQNCECGEPKTTDVPALTDAIWTKSVKESATYNEGGKDLYTSIYGTVEVASAKLVAPYDYKTYSSFNFDASTEEGFKNGVLSVETVWAHAVLTLNGEGKGVGTAYPFRGAYQYVIVNAETGEIAINEYKQKTEEVWVPDTESMDPEAGEFVVQGVVDKDGNPVYDWTAPVKTTTAWVDFETGLIVAPRNATYDDINVLTPYEVNLAVGKAYASAWDNAIAIEYVIGGKTHNIFVYNGRAYFNVNFLNLKGSAINVTECYNATNLHVTNENGELIAGFAFNGEKLVIADGLEGEYSNGADKLTLNGCGSATINGESAKYVISGETVGLYVANEYYEITLNGATYTAVKPMVEITFDAGEYATVESVVVNKNIVIELPVPTSETHYFKGWYTDSAFTTAVSMEYAPAQDITLYGLWEEKVEITIVGGLEGENNVILLGAGDVIGDALPKYGIEVSIGKVFRGWYLDAEFTITLPEEAVVTPEDTGISVYAKWEELPAYYGTYYGSEIWNVSYGNSGGRSITIDENGVMTGSHSGIIVSYDPETQIIEYKDSQTATRIKKMYFNAEVGVIAGLYTTDAIANDYYLYSKYTSSTNGKVNAQYGLQAAKEPGSSTRGYYAQFVNVNVAEGTKELFLYNNYIYSDFTATDAEGNPLTAATVKTSKIVIVKDANGNVIVSLASVGTSFQSNSTTVDLDTYFGTYVNGEETVVLDGVGNITYGDKSGTYEKVEDKDYGFDVYLNNGAEYWQLTLNGESFTMVKPMVLITFDAGEYATVEPVELNVNISYTLPVPTHESNVFNGWYYDEGLTKAVGGSIIPTEEATLYACWKVKAVLTVVYNNGEENGEFIYSVGDSAQIAVPVYAKHAFAGWYTTENFAEGTEWASGSEITEDLTVYAKWEDAPAYYNNYTVTRIQDTNLQGEGYIYCYVSSGVANLFEVDPNGTCTKKVAPFSSGFVIENYNAETGYLEIVSGTYTYAGYMDSKTGIIVVEYLSGKGLNQVFFLNPISTETVNKDNLFRSYWNYGKSRAVQYVNNGTTYSFFVNNDMVYFGVSFKNGQGENVPANECNTAQILYIYDSNGELIAKFAHDGSVLQEMDGYEGTYTSENGEVTVNGVNTITIGGVSGSYAKAEEGATYTHDAYVGNEYFEVTLNKEDKTAVVNKPMVTITFVSEHTAVESVTVNKNIAIELAQPTNDAYIFRAWYTDAEYTNAVSNNYLPTESLTLYAKWDAKITLTVIYGNGLDEAVLYYGVGDTAAPVEPVYTNGMVFDGWYLDAELTIAYEVGAIEENTVIYCKWKDAVAAYGSYRGFNLYGANKQNLTLGKNLSITAEGTVSGTIKGSFLDYDETTGVARIVDGSKTWYTYLNVEHGIIAFAYNANETSLGTDMYLFFKNASSVKYQSAKLTSEGFTELLNVVNSDGSSYSLLVMNDRVEVVTWEVLEGSADNEQAIGNASKFIVYTEGGDIAYEFTKSGSSFTIVEKSLKVAAGTYVGVSVSGSSETAATTNVNEYVYRLIVDADSKTTDKKTGEIKDYDYKTGLFKLWTSTSSYNYGYYNADLGVLMYAGSAKKDTFGYSYCIYFLGATEVNVKDAASHWNNGLTRIMDITVDGVVRSAFMYNDVLYMDVTYTSSTENVTAATAWTASDFTVYDSEGNEIAKFVNSGGVLVEKTDGFEGTYAVEGGEIVIDGFGSITMGGVVGTYTIAEEGAEHTINATVGEKRYEITLNKESLTAVVAEAKILVSVATSNPYAFTYNASTNEFVSGNAGHDSTTSTLTITAKGTVTLTFSYFAGGESDWDKMSIKLNGTSQSVEKDSGASFNQYIEYTITLNAGDVLTINYTKDSSGASYYDYVAIRNLVANGTAIIGFVE